MITVIVPIYNVELYLRKCIDSITGQSYKNLEIILVDDGSQDKCGLICDEYAEKDSRVRVIHKENGGLSDARNAALDVMKGEYVTFIDSDDYVATEYISYLYDLIKHNDADIAICGYKYITEDGKVLNHLVDDDTVMIMDQEKAFFELLKSKYFSNSACSKLFRADCFEGIRYPYGRLYEDVATTYKTFFKSEKIVFGANPLYFYLYRVGSISKQQFSLARMDGIYFAEEMVKDITQKYPSLCQIGDCRLFDSYLAVLSLISQKDYPDIYKQVWGKICFMRKSILICKYSGRKRKILSICSYFGTDVLKMML